MESGKRKLLWGKATRVVFRFRHAGVGPKSADRPPLRAAKVCQ
jgi:hypothetical protein